MHTFHVSIPSHELSLDYQNLEFGEVIQVARAQAAEFDAVAYITQEGADVGCPNRWAVSPKGFLTVEDVQLPRCVGCGN